MGYLNKAACHDGEGILHRAFSLFIFNDNGELLLQKRAAGKRLWPNYWSNSCCSHPRRGESMETAIQRRCEQELGFQTTLTFLYKFIYSATFGNLGSERELCSVYVGRYSDAPRVNSNEISEWRWVDTHSLDVSLEQNPQDYTPWFKLEWRHLQEQFSSHIPPGESHQ